jgi:TFIIH basal transcription factor complex TTD-A subunit
VVCDASIKSIIVKIDSEDHAFIVEELDDTTLVVKENMLSILKMRLDEVSAGAADVMANLTCNPDSQRDPATSRGFRRGIGRSLYTNSNGSWSPPLAVV